MQEAEKVENTSLSSSSTPVIVKQKAVAFVSPTVTPRRGDGDTPLSGIRPISVQNEHLNKVAAVLPSTSQTIPSASSCSTATALVTSQQIHTAGEVMFSSHTDYVPATSTTALIVVAAVSPMVMAYIH